MGLEKHLPGTPSTLNDLVTEIALAARPEKEEGITAYTIPHLKKALAEYRDKGGTSLLEVSRHEV